MNRLCEHFGHQVPKRIYLDHPAVTVEHTTQDHGHIGRVSAIRCERCDAVVGPLDKDFPFIVPAATPLNFPSDRKLTDSASQGSADTRTQITQLWTQIACLWICVFALLIVLITH